MKNILAVLTMFCVLDEIPQEKNDKKTEETTPGDEGGDNSDDDGWLMNLFI